MKATDNVGRTALTYATIYSEYHAAEYLAKIGYIPKDKPGNPGKGSKKPFIATDAKPVPPANAEAASKENTPKTDAKVPEQKPAAAVPEKESATATKP